MALSSGVPQCGRAYQQWYDCRLEACVDCFDDRDFAKCYQNAGKSACKKAFDAVTPSCGGQAAVSKAESFCFGDHILYGPLISQCVGFGDGGADAGP
jgi:hypothetical protein